MFSKDTQSKLDELWLAYEESGCKYEREELRELANRLMAEALGLDE